MRMEQLPHLDVGAEETVEFRPHGLHLMLIGLSGADILGAAGQLEVATTISPVQLAIDNEVFGTVRRMIANISFDDDSLAWADLLAADLGDSKLVRSLESRRLDELIEEVRQLRAAVARNDAVDDDRADGSRST